MSRRPTSLFAAALLLLGIVAGSSAGAAAADSVTQTDSVLGIALAHPGTMNRTNDQYLFESYGFTLTEAKDPGHDHASLGEAWVHVGWKHAVGSTDIQAAAQAVIDTFPEVPIVKSETQVAGLPAVVLTGVPGLQETTYVYVAANGRLYEFISSGGGFDAKLKSILATVKFARAAVTLESLHLTRAEDALFMVPQPVIAKPISADMQPTRPGDSTIGIQAIAGCTDYPTAKYLQTPIDAWTNGNGWSAAGPSYYGEGLHTGCNLSSNQNDYYALDFPMGAGNGVLNVSDSGTVMWAGWATGGWQSLGRTVVVGNGGGWRTLYAHLSHIQVSNGQAVNANTYIGNTGGSGYGQDNYWSPHLHLANYYNATVSGGGTYGGQSAQMIKVHYCRNGCSNYYWGFTKGQSISY